jgi:fatty-acyl-CoA synthase
VSHPHTHHLTASPEEALDYRTLAGIPAPLVDLRIVDPNMNEVPHDGKR